MHANQVADADAGCGIRLRRAREAAGLSQEDVATRLKMPLRVVQSLEAEDWSRLGAPVFVRGQLRSYSRLLGLGTATTIEAANVGPVEPPALVTHAYIPRHQRVFEQLSRRLAYIAITIAIAGSVWMGTRSHLPAVPGNVESLDLPADRPTSFGTASPDAPPAANPPARRTPMLASMAGVGNRTVSPHLTLRFTGDSWVKVVAADGSILEQGLLPAGSTRSYGKSKVGSVVLGNAGAVEVELGGEAMELAPYQRANVARFTVSSDGSLAPVAD